MTALATAATAHADVAEFENRPVADVRVDGLRQTPLQLVRNQIRMQAGDPFQQAVVNEDVVRITHVGGGLFSAVTAEVQPRDDGSVVLTYVLVEKQRLADIQVVGNKNITDKDIMALVIQRRGDPVDQFLIDQDTVKIKQAYEQKGYFLTEVSVDPQLLADSGVLVFRVREGPKVKITDIRFEGAHAFPTKQLHAQIKSKRQKLLMFWRKTELNREQLDVDAAAIRQYYHDRGFLDAEVGRRIDLSADQQHAVVVFQIQEGQRYTVAAIQVQGNTLFSSQQVVEAMPLQVGEVYSTKLAIDSRDAVAAMYGKLGFIAARVSIGQLFDPQQPTIDLIVTIVEGQPYLVGTIEVRGNDVTKDRVILREVRGMEPNRRFDGTQVAKTEQRLRELPLFSSARVTLLGDEQDLYRDVLIQVQETNTGSLSFGVGVSSDLGLLGQIGLTQRNFDIADPPRSLTDLFTGKAFRGAGQTFSVNLAPGLDNSSYSVSLHEPYLMATNLFSNVRGFYHARQREDWDENRLGGSLGLGRRFGDVWSGSLSARAETIEIQHVDTGTPVDVVAEQGENALTALALSITRSTTDSQVTPTKGSTLTTTVRQAGAMGGNYDFTAADLQFHKFWTMDEDYLGRKSVLSVDSSIGYIVAGDAPVFERFYAGGHRSFRGFEYRGVGPRGVTAGGVTTNDPVGGDFLFLLGAQYDIPIYQDILHSVIFIDTGTLRNDVGLDQYRVSVGAGLRVRIPQLTQDGPPIALDFGFPLRKEDGDQEQLFSFDLAVPF